MPVQPDSFKVVIDTNVFVAAGINQKSYSAKIITLIRRKQLILIWNQATIAESRKILRQIPPLDWEEFAILFKPEYEIKTHLAPGKFELINDQEDRKFAALAAYSQALLITNDEHLLSVRPYLKIDIFTSTEAYQIFEGN